ncbi:hypothetical protein EG68_11270 [Paragonimus skrjabini miyazakii]|uniref:RRP12 N-terminal HEAT domain-containing protein n=1 Tax=Paragonimus skrjabini miyazakii TaxID=59628 RepID=A0A8S9YI20_9TREM|nr:hypothetical protein EG68_11270 [Paragonimus skrjabini miyazakii]
MDVRDRSSLSFVSWATNVTKCSNPAFEKVISRVWNNPELQKDVLAVLTGVTKLIHDKGGTESAAEYYATLVSIYYNTPKVMKLTALNTPSCTKPAEAYLLKLIMCQAVPDSLLRATFAEAAKILVHLLTSCSAMDATHISILKPLLICLGRLLRAQFRESWSLESVRHIYRYILRFIDCEKPTVRRSSHIAVCNILHIASNDGTDENVFHPACHQTVQHICVSIRQEMRYVWFSTFTIVTLLCGNDV